MKNFFTLVFSVFALSAMAQNEVKIYFNHLMGDEALTMNTVTTADGGYELTFTRVEYYISGIQLIHDGGQVTDVADTYLLVDAETTNAVSLGTFNVEHLEGLKFYIGVDEAHNHLDPGSYPADSPLSPQIPTMHWGWASGYRFVCLEGWTAPGQSLIYQIHALGDDYYYANNLDADITAVNGELNIGLQANYLNMLLGIDVSSGLVVHGTYDEAIALLQNMSIAVFEIADFEFTATQDVLDKQAVSLFPNPANNLIQLKIDRPTNNDLQITIQDLSGKHLMALPGVIGMQEISVANLPAGIYLLRVTQNGSLVDVEKLVIGR
ncbi:MAG: T9SS type A sorting domain-containing protein [Saprospiraceae bacterium]|nr:T9SS type A sorting domain-containing protein [Saprospiraceae bacterium]